MSDLFDWDDRKRLASVYQQAADESSLEPSSDTEKHYAGLIAVAAYAATEADEASDSSGVLQERIDAALMACDEDVCGLSEIDAIRAALTGEATE